MKERQQGKLNRKERKRIAIPLPPDMVDEEAVRKALENFAAAVRENRTRPREVKPENPRDFWEPVFQKI